MSKREIQLLIGDNAFHGISHLSQQRARERSAVENPSNIEHAAHLVNLAIENGARGFMFSVSETTLGILTKLDPEKKIDLYAIVPYAFEYVRMATHAGGISGLAKKVSMQIIFSRNMFSVFPSLIGILRVDPSAILRIYLIYELARIKKAGGENANLKSILLHEVITDMALALNLDWFFKSYIKLFSTSTILPGFETRNFPYLVEKFTEWHINMNEITICASFNKIGFQMNPSKIECESALQKVSGAQIIAMSTLAAGYLNLSEAMLYLANLPKIAQVVVGVSTKRQASETFKLLQRELVGTARESRY